MKTTIPQSIAPRFIAALLATSRAWFIKVLAVIIVGVISTGEKGENGVRREWR